MVREENEDNVRSVATEVSKDPKVTLVLANADHKA